MRRDKSARRQLAPFPSVWDAVETLEERVRVLEAHVRSLQTAQPRGIPSEQAPCKESKP